MSLLDKIYKSSILHYIPKYFLRKLKRKFNYSFVEIHLDKLPKKNHPSAIIFKGQEDLLINFKSKDYIPKTSCPYLIWILKFIFVDNSKKYNFLDFGGENIDHYLYLKKNFKNLRYFYFNQKEHNQVIFDIKKKYSLDDLTVLDNLDEIKKYNYNFVNFGSVILYVEDYKFVLNELIDTRPEYIFLSGQIYYEKQVNDKENIIVKQVNVLPLVNFCYFFEYLPFLKIFKSKKFELVYDILNITDISFKNFNDKYGKIKYSDLLFKNLNQK